jgi:hypothetical protein
MVGFMDMVVLDVMQERKREIIVSVLGKDSRDQKSSQMSEKELGFLFGL